MNLTRVVSLVVLVFSAAPGVGEAGQPVPVPAEIAATDLPDPFPWPTHIFADDPVAMEFSVDLDRIAPMGTKKGNGTAWFAAFAKNIGDRRDDVEAAQESALAWEYHGKERRVLPPDHPLLIEADSRPW